MSDTINKIEIETELIKLRNKWIDNRTFLESLQSNRPAETFNQLEQAHDLMIRLLREHCGDLYLVCEKFKMDLNKDC